MCVDDGAVNIRKRLLDIYLSVLTFTRISIRAGNHFNDLTEIEQIEMSEPPGWVVIPLKDINDKPIRTFMIQVI